MYCLRWTISPTFNIGSEHGPRHEQWAYWSIFHYTFHYTFTYFLSVNGTNVFFFAVCNGPIIHVNTPSTTNLTSPGYPRDYPSYGDCQWLVTTQSGSYVSGIEIDKRRS